MSADQEPSAASSEADPAAATPGDRDLQFTLAGFLKGMQASIPVAIGVVGYGLVFGLLARQAGLSTTEVALMSATVFAGAAQFVAIGLWETPIPVVTIVVATFVVNLRFILMGASLRPWFRSLSRVETYGSAILLGDENWALTIKRLADGSRNGAFLVGSGFLMYSTWVVATAVGTVAGTAIPDPARFGLDFAFTAVFTTLLVGLWDGRRDLLPWAVAAVVAVAGKSLLPGSWYILLGGIAGCLTAMGVYDAG